MPKILWKKYGLQLLIAAALVPVGLLSQTQPAPQPPAGGPSANVDWNKVDEPNFGQNAAKQLEADVKAGAQGLKVFKDLGMFVFDKSGKRLQTDDPRLDPVWDKCAELGIPVLIHTGEP